MTPVDADRKRRIALNMLYPQALMTGAGAAGARAATAEA